MNFSIFKNILDAILKHLLWRPLFHWNEMCAARIAHRHLHRSLHLRRRHHPTRLSRHCRIDLSIANAVRRLLSCSLFLNLLNNLQHICRWRLSSWFHAHSWMMMSCGSHATWAHAWLHGRTSHRRIVGGSTGRADR